MNVFRLRYFFHAVCISAVACGGSDDAGPRCGAGTVQVGSQCVLPDSGTGVGGAGTGGAGGAGASSGSGGVAGGGGVAANAGAAGLDASVPDAGGQGGGGAGGDAATLNCPLYLDAGAGAPATSCSGGPGADATCGKNGNEDCCASPAVPCGQFNRSNNILYPATLTSHFRLDRFEVTVGRFRKFVDAGFGTQAKPPAPGAGAHPKIPATGWDPNWNSELPTDTDQLKKKLTVVATNATWTPQPDTNEYHAINQVGWYVAFAFCVWDGGRLPTEAEWNFAAASMTQYYFPWGGDKGSATPAHAKYGGGSVVAVGSFPLGVGRWGQMDLAGNVAEWVFDRAGPYPVPCVDCVTAVPGFKNGRVTRGGNFSSSPDGLNTFARWEQLLSVWAVSDGIRCAREL